MHYTYIKKDIYTNYKPYMSYITFNNISRLFIITKPKRYFNIVFLFQPLLLPLMTITNVLIESEYLITD